MSIDASTIGDFLSHPPSYAAIAFAILGTWWGYKEVVRRTKVDEKTDALLDRLQGRCDELEDELKALHESNINFATSSSGASSTVIHLQDKLNRSEKDCKRLADELAREKRAHQGAGRTIDFLNFNMLKLMMIFNGMRFSALPEDPRWDRLEELLPALMAEVTRRRQVELETVYGEPEDMITPCMVGVGINPDQSEPPRDPASAGEP